MSSQSETTGSVPQTYPIVGHCPQCGAPIYAKKQYGDLPPLSVHSCSCILQKGLDIDKEPK